MALETVHKDSCMCSKSELDLFSIPPTQVVMEKGFWKDVDPITLSPPQRLTSSF
jgi:hypothetical protein